MIAPGMATRLPPNDVLRRMYSTRTVVDADGGPLPLSGEIAPAYAAALYRTVLSHKPDLVVEIGMACGASTLSILTALEEVNCGGRLVSIDPTQTTEWKGAGVAGVRRSGLASRHRLMEMPSHEALPRLLADGTRIDLAYVDGWHTFDYVLLDFFYLDKMLPVGGIIGFNDCGLRAVHRVLSFLRTHRKYRELKTGLPRSFRGRHPMISLLRRVLRRSREDRYFEKVEDWEPSWNFYARF
jgi:predicted O-methyltransferase YrrM